LGPEKKNSQIGVRGPKCLVNPGLESLKAPACQNNSQNNLSVENSRIS